MQSRFAILRNTAHVWHTRTLGEIMYDCIILHNMIVEDERDSYEGRHDFNYEQGTSPIPLIGYGQGPIRGFDMVLDIGVAIRNKEMHHRLKNDLTELIWENFGGNQHQ